MSTRTVLRPHAVITNGAMTGNITSEVTVLQSLTRMSYAASWSGTSPVGTLSVQVSNDYTLDSAGFVANAGTWTTVTLNVTGSPVSSVPVSGNTGTVFIDIDGIAAYAMRCVYTFTSGTGTLNVTIVGKVS